MKARKNLPPFEKYEVAFSQRGINVLCENTHAQLLIKKISLMCKLIAQKSYIWCLKALKWHHDEVPFLIWQKLQNLWSPKVLQKAKMIFFTHILQLSSSYKQPCTNLCCLLLFEFHFLPSKKSNRGHFFCELLDIAQWTVLHGLMPCRVILLGTKFKIRISSDVLTAVN